ncbi:MAG: TonB-dependent receptor [Bryobacterales bacterium]|nr:TonB-dependent receptor [Bryobacterales bacterium]
MSPLRQRPSRPRLVAWAAPLAVLAGMVCAPAARAVEPGILAGTLSGIVANTTGVPQMGATVLLYNRFDRMVARAITNDRGNFSFFSLPADTYSLRVQLPSFVPAVKRNIAIQAGMRSFLSINLATIFSTVELIYVAPSQAAIMSEDWKWVLRGSGATRPVLRIIAGEIDISDPGRRRQSAAMFSGTQGIVRVSAGDGGASTAAGSQTDLGTAFALATSVFGSNRVQFSGNLGYASAAGIPAAGFSTSYQRQAGAEAFGPEVSLTMRQIFLPSRTGAALGLGQSSGLPALRSMSLTLSDQQEISEGLTVEYGATLESVSFLERLNVLSPFARLRWGSDNDGAFEIGYSNGAPPMELLNHAAAPEADLQHSLSTLSLFPRISLSGGAARVQRTENIEAGYRRRFGSRTVAGSVFREGVSNAALTMASPAGFFGGADLLPDLASNSSVFNIGGYRRMGYVASISQQVGEDLTATVGYQYTGALAPGAMAQAGDAASLRSTLHHTQRGSTFVRITGRAPATGTYFSSSYQFADYGVLTPVHLSLTQRATFEPGFNLYLRQPIPGVPGMFSGRLEATAELRNLLAQGYVPIYSPDGRQVLLIQSPRSLRGGLSFIF